MRQGDGSDLQGVNASRSKDIGIIYVAPSDDRQSVLAAILTQDKLGRKQVTIVLPDQNKAFQRPVDFDGLKNMQRGLKVRIIFIAPSGSSPAELARQRRFPIYSSLETYARSQQEETQAGRVARRGWLPLIGQKSAGAISTAPTNPLKTRQKQPQPPPNTAVASAQPPQTATTNGDVKDDPHSSSTILGAAAIGAAAIGAGALATSASGPSTPPAAPDPAAQSATDPLPDEDAPTREITGTSVPSPSPATADEDDTASKIIPFSSRGGTTDKIPIPAITPIPAVQPQVPPVNPTPATRQQNAGNIAAVGVGASAAAAGLAAAGGTPVARTVRGGGTPPTRGSTAGSGGGPQGPRRPVRRRLLLALVGLLVLFLLVCGTIVYASPGIFSRFNLSNPLSGLTPSATVTITPTSMHLSNTYTIFGVTGNPDTSLRQVQARQLTFTTPSQSKTANATGTGYTPGVQATGTITFQNGSFIDRLVAAGTTFNVANGLQVVTDRAVDIPPANPSSSALGVASVPAHVTSGGASGNIAALTINQVCCSGSSAIYAKNLDAFSGGQDPQTFTVVQQSDINGVANPLKTMLLSTAQQSLQSQMQPNEHFISSPQCTPNVTSNHAAGDAASSVTVTVKAACAGEVYDQQGVQMIAANLLKQQATTTPGAGYMLVGNLVTGITQVTPTGPNKGTLEMLVSAEGIWVFQFSDAQKQALARLIAGKRKQDAQTLLLQQMGVTRADIQLNGGDGKTLPTDPTQITIVVLNVPGLQVTPLTTPTPTVGPTSGPGTPTAPIAPPISPTATPTVGLGG